MIFVAVFTLEKRVFRIHSNIVLTFNKQIDRGDSIEIWSLYQDGLDIYFIG